MPPRYQQNRLASSQVGTPGLDKAASEGAAAVAKAASSFRNTLDPIQTFFLGQASQDFQQLRALGMQKQREAAYYKRQEDAALLQLGIHESRNAASLALKKRQNEIQADYADRPILGEQVFNKEVDRVIETAIPPDLKPREKAMYQRSLSDERRQSLEAMNSWRHQTQRDTADKQFTGGLEDLKALAGSQGNTGDFTGFKQALDRWSSPEAFNRAYMLRKDKGVADVKAALSDAHAKFAFGLGLKDPDAGMKLAQVWAADGRMPLEALTKVRTELDHQRNLIKQTENDARVAQERSWKTDDHYEYYVPARVSRSLPEVNKILDQSKDKLAELKLSGAPKERVNIMADVVGQIENIQNTRFRGVMEAGSLQLQQAALASTARTNERLDAIAAQTTPDAIKIRTDFQSKYRQVIEYKNPEKNLPEYSALLDEALTSYKGLSDKGLEGLPFTTQDELVRFGGELKAKQAAFAGYMTQQTRRVREQPLQNAIRTGKQEILGSIPGLNRSSDVIAGVAFEPPSAEYVQEIQRRNPKWSADAIQQEILGRFFPHVREWRERNPDKPVVRQGLLNVRKAIEAQVKDDLMRGR